MSPTVGHNDLCSPAKRRISSLINEYFNFYLEIAEAASDLLPDCDEREAKEESQGASEIGDQGEKGVEKDLLLNLSKINLQLHEYDLGCAGNCPEGDENLVLWCRSHGVFAWSAARELVFLVAARLLTSSNLEYFFQVVFH